MDRPPLLPDWYAVQRMRSIFSSIVLIENVVFSSAELKKERVIPWGLKEYLLASRKLKAMGRKRPEENERLDHHVFDARPSGEHTSASEGQENVLEALRYKETRRIQFGNSTSRITPI